METQWTEEAVYKQALKDRARTFRDPAIQSGVLVEDKTGPMSLNGSGKYVCVFQVDKWVLRFFTVSSPKRLAERYQAILNYINSYARELPFLIEHEWVERGILVEGRYVPYLKVAFIEDSMQLGTFLQENYSDGRSVQKIADLFLNMITKMEKRGIAHGDLDITNVLVYGKYPDLSLKLIDYDGMYVPTMARRGFEVVDLGHIHFQPIKQQVRVFGSEMDRFSALIIYLSLIALAREPSLWDNCGASESDRLLLGADDYERLNMSKNYGRLYQQDKNPILRKCLHELEHAITDERMPRALQEIIAGPDTEKPLQAPVGRRIPLGIPTPVEPEPAASGPITPPFTPPPLSTTIGAPNSAPYNTTSYQAPPTPNLRTVPPKKGRGGSITFMILSMLGFTVGLALLGSSSSMGTGVILIVVTIIVFLSALISFINNR